MAQKHQIKVRGYKELKKLYEVYRRIDQRRGIDFHVLLIEWSETEKQRLSDPGARKDFVVLCEQGCVPQVLAAIVCGLRYSPWLEQFFANLICSPTKKEKAVRTLEKAASTLDDLFQRYLQFPDEDVEGRLTSIGRLTPWRLASELRLYGRVITMTESLARETGTRSLKELGKYLLASYVKRITGKFHDANVSALLAETVGPIDYDEVAQRMWRSRNYSRIDKHLDKLTDFLVGISLVMAEQNVTESEKK